MENRNARVRRPRARGDRRSQHRGETSRTSPLSFSRRGAPRATAVFETYWRFAAERQRIFFRRLCCSAPPFSNDPIFREYRFTNAYRASDRVSQYLIRNVIYDDDHDVEQSFFRIILFKIFNRIETWEYLRSKLSDLTLESFNVGRLDKLLSAALNRGQKIYSAAYIMPPGGRRARKHLVHLELLERMLNEGVPARIADAGSMEEGYRILTTYPTVGPFLGYQWITDLNYSPHLEFDEMEFVMAGPGARDGIRKCFHELDGWTDNDVIRMIASEQMSHFERLGIDFQDLFGRPLQLIDCQNLFCEVDKYARVRHPEIQGVSGRKKIKQKFRQDLTPLELHYPPKWGLSPVQPAAPV